MTSPRPIKTMSCIHPLLHTHTFNTHFLSTHTHTPTLNTQKCSRLQRPETRTTAVPLTDKTHWQFERLERLQIGSFNKQSPIHQSPAARLEPDQNPHHRDQEQAQREPCRTEASAVRTSTQGAWRLLCVWLYMAGPQRGYKRDSVCVGELSGVSSGVYRGLLLLFTEAVKHWSPQITATDAVYGYVCRAWNFDHFGRICSWNCICATWNYIWEHLCQRT